MTTDWTPLDAYVETLAGECDLGVSVAGPAAAHWHHQGDVQFPSASTVKIPIMIEVHRLMDAGQVRLDDMHTLHNDEKSPGSGVLRYLHDGLQLTVADLLYLMMSISDNTATNVLIDLAGMAAINDTMRTLGMSSSILGRPMLGRLAIEGEQENLATANDFTRVLATIVEGKAASPAACAAMLETLQRQQNHRRIGRHVPDDDGTVWGSKTGTNDGVVNDVGFVVSPAGTLLVAVYCRGVSNEVRGEGIVAEIAQRAMRCAGIIAP